MLSKTPNGISFEPNRCCQCGVCLSVCPRGALSAHVDYELLIYRIDWQSEKCNLCGRCIKACPAYVTSTWSVQQNQPEIQGTYLAWVTEERLRYISSSGGVGRGLIQVTLNRGLADYVYTLVKTEAFPWAEGQWMCDVEDPSIIANSMYLPLMFGKNLYPIPKGDRILVVGLPCQLAAFRRSLSDNNIKRDIITIAIFCKQQKTFGFARFLASMAGYELSFCPPISFRGNGWPGRISAGSYSVAYKEIASLIYGKKLWRLPACCFCANPFASGADLVLADPWGISGHFIDAGKTLVFAMTERGVSIIKADERRVVWEKIPSELAFTSIDWAGIVRKAKLMRIYAGQHKGTLGQIKKGLLLLVEGQRRVYEHLLNRYKPPIWIQKAIGNLPDWSKY